MSEENKLYEISFNILSSVPEEAVSAEVAKIKESLSKNGAEIVKEGETKLIDLAYTMIKKVASNNKKYDKAYFGWIKFNATSEAVVQIKSEMDVIENVLRFMIIKTVDDDEHSTAKIENTEQVGEQRAEKGDGVSTEEKVEDSKEEEKSNEKDLNESKDSSVKKVDEAIDELVK